MKEAIEKLVVIADYDRDVEPLTSNSELRSLIAGMVSHYKLCLLLYFLTSYFLS